MKQGRGELTDRIKEKSKKMFGYEITAHQLRLLPFLQYTMENGHVLKPIHMNIEEVMFMKRWENEGYMQRDINNENKISITKEFWDIMSELIYLGYVDLS